MSFKECNWVCWGHKFVHYPRISLRY